MYYLRYLLWSPPWGGVPELDRHFRGSHRSWSLINNKIFSILNILPSVFIKMELVVAPTELGRCTRSCIQWKPRSKWTKKLIKFVQFQTLDHRFIFLYNEGLSECWSGKIFCVSRLVTEQWGIVIIIIKKKAVVPVFPRRYGNRSLVSRPAIKWQTWRRKRYVALIC